MGLSLLKARLGARVTEHPAGVLWKVVDPLAELQRDPFHLVVFGIFEVGLSPDSTGGSNLNFALGPSIQFENSPRAFIDSNLRILKSVSNKLALGRNLRWSGDWLLLRLFLVGSRRRVGCRRFTRKATDNQAVVMVV